MPWFPQRKGEKGEMWEHQPREGKAAFHQAADESFVHSQEVRCTKEGLCTMEDAQSVISFGAQLRDVAFSGKIMADGEAQKFE